MFHCGFMCAFSCLKLPDQPMEFLFCALRWRTTAATYNMSFIVGTALLAYLLYCGPRFPLDVTLAMCSSYPCQLCGDGKTEMCNYATTMSNRMQCRLGPHDRHELSSCSHCVHRCVAHGMAHTCVLAHFGAPGKV